VNVNFKQAHASFYLSFYISYLSAFGFLEILFLKVLVVGYRHVVNNSVDIQDAFSEILNSVKEH